LDGLGVIEGFVGTQDRGLRALPRSLRALLGLLRDTEGLCGALDTLLGEGREAGRSRGRGRHQKGGTEGKKDEESVPAWTHHATAIGLVSRLA
jgi:hypothetical protein